jgi:hypothetical protein
MEAAFLFLFLLDMFLCEFELVFENTFTRE